MKTIFKANKTYFVSYSFLQKYTTSRNVNEDITTYTTAFGNAILKLDENTDLTGLTRDLQESTKLQNIVILYYFEIK